MLAVYADIYAFVDTNGVRHLSNIPNDPRYKLVMRTPAYSRASAQNPQLRAKQSVRARRYCV